MSKVITKYAINCSCAAVCFSPPAVANKKCSACNIVTEQSPTLALSSPLVLSDPVLNYERMWVSPFSKLKGNICLINVILICLYWTLNNNLPSSHSLVCLPECTCFLRSDFLNIYLWDLSNFSIDWWDTAPVCTEMFSQTFCRLDKTCSQIRFHSSKRSNTNVFFFLVVIWLMNMEVFYMLL